MYHGRHIRRLYYLQFKFLVNFLNVGYIQHISVYKTTSKITEAIYKITEAIYKITEAIYKIKEAIYKIREACYIR